MINVIIYFQSEINILNLSKYKSIYDKCYKIFIYFNKNINLFMIML